MEWAHLTRLNNYSSSVLVCTHIGLLHVSFILIIAHLDCNPIIKSKQMERTIETSKVQLTIFLAHTLVGRRTSSSLYQDRFSAVRTNQYSFAPPFIIPMLLIVSHPFRMTCSIKGELVTVEKTQIHHIYIRPGCLPFIATSEELLLLDVKCSPSFP